MTTVPNPYLHDASASVWADRVKEMSREDLLDLASGLLSILGGCVGHYWNEADDLVREYRPYLDKVTHGLGMSPDVHALLATAQQAIQSLHKEACGMRADGLMSGLREGPRMVASMGGKKKSENRGTNAAKDAIRAAWASGKYSTRAICAEQEAAALGISFDTARKALRNTPDPD